MLYKATRNKTGTMLNYIILHPHVVKHIFNISEMIWCCIAVTSCGLTFQQYLLRIVLMPS